MATCEHSIPNGTAVPIISAATLRDHVAGFDHAGAICAAIARLADFDMPNHDLWLIHRLAEIGRDIACRHSDEAASVADRIESAEVAA